jgi:hypothetical protein
VPDDEQPPPDDDKFRPDAIAARIDKLGTETESDRLAREEEQKLLERKKDRKKSGLEAAASKRLAKIGEGKVKRPSAIAADVVGGDALIDRINSFQKWLREHQQVAAAAGVAAVMAGVVGFGVVYWRERRDEQASVLLAQAIADEHGHIATAKDDSDDEPVRKALYPTFKTAAERRDAALAKYRTAESKFSGTGAAILARLAEAGILLDQGDAKGALTAYDDVRQSPLAAADAQVRGRALEGKGFANELLARTDAAARDKHLDDALTDFKALEAVDSDFKDLGMYHQARLALEKGDRAKATDILKDLMKRVSGSDHGPPSYLQLVVEDRLRELDPAAVPPKTPKGFGPGGGDALGGLGGLGGAGGPNHIDMSDPRIQELIRQLKERPAQGGQGAPPPPAGSAP